LILCEVLDLWKKELIAAVGGGGKTSIVFRLSRELLRLKKSVLLSTTTKMYFPRGNDITVVIEDKKKSMFQKICNFYAGSGGDGNWDNGIVVIGKGVLPDNKIKGVEREILNEIFQRGLAEYIVVEADGAKQKPIKVPAPYEPVIPEKTTTVLGIVGIDAVGKPLTEEFFHRVEIAYRRLGYPYGKEMDEELIASVVTWEEGLFKNTPAAAKKVFILNKVDGKKERKQAEKIAELVMMKRGKIIPERIVFTSVISENPVVEVFV